MKRKIRMYVVFLSISLLCMMPIVQSVQGRVVLDEEIEISSDPHIDEDSLINLADEDDKKYSNYELFWDDWKKNHSKEGVTASTLTPPTLIEEERDDYDEEEKHHIGVTTKFSHSQIMQGSSKHWWRSPFSVDEYDYDLQLRLYRVTSASDVNITADEESNEGFSISEQSNPSKVFDSEVNRINPENMLDDENIAIENIDSEDEYINTYPARSVTENTALFGGNISFDEEQYDTIDVNFQYRKNTTNEWSETSTQTLRESKEVKEFKDDLDGGVGYEYRIVDTTTGQTGEIKEFKTEFDEKSIHSNNFISETQYLPDELTNESDEDISYNFDYIKANAPIYAEEDYLALWTIKDATPDYLVSNDDVGENEQYKTWEVRNRENPIDEIFEVDFDVGTTFSTGMADHVGGDNINSDFTMDLGDSAKWTWTRKLSLESMTEGEFVNFNLPFLSELEEGDIEFTLTYTFKTKNSEGVVTRNFHKSDFIIDSVSYGEIDQHLSPSVSDVYEVEIQLEVGKVVDDISESVYLGQNVDGDIDIAKLSNFDEDGHESKESFGDLGHTGEITAIETEDDMFYTSGKDGRLVRYDEDNNEWNELWSIGDGTSTASLTVEISSEPSESPHKSTDDKSTDNKSTNNESTNDESTDDELNEELMSATTTIQEPSGGDSFYTDGDIESEVTCYDLNDHNTTDTRLVIQILENDSSIREKTETWSAPYDNDYEEVTRTFDEGVEREEYERDADYSVHTHIEDKDDTGDWDTVTDSADDIDIDIEPIAETEILEPPEGETFEEDEDIYTEVECKDMIDLNETTTNLEIHLIEDGDTLRTGGEYFDEGHGDTRTSRYTFDDGVEHPDPDADYTIETVLSNYDPYSDSWEFVDGSTDEIDINVEGGETLELDTPVENQGFWVNQHIESQASITGMDTNDDYLVEFNIYDLDNTEDYKVSKEYEPSGTSDTIKHVFLDGVEEGDYGNDYHAEVKLKEWDDDDDVYQVVDDIMVDISILETPTTINGVNQLQAMRWNLDVDYTLGSDIDASNSQNDHETQYDGSWSTKDAYFEDDIVEDGGNNYLCVESHIADSDNNPTGNDDNWTQTDLTGGENLGFHPVGEGYENEFEGNFDGDGYEINDLYINRPDESSTGLFGRTEDTVDIKDVGLQDCYVSGKSNVGSLVGRNDGYISEVYTSSSEKVEGSSDVGGLVGWSTADSEIVNSYSMIDVDGSEEVGGFVGYNRNLIEKSYSTGAVSGSTDIGGFCGLNDDTISNSFWDTETSGTTSSSGGTGKTTSEMKGYGTYNDAGWDIDINWATESSYPYHGSSWTIDQGEPNIDVFEPSDGASFYEYQPIPSEAECTNLDETSDYRVGWTYSDEGDIHESQTDEEVSGSDYTSPVVFDNQVDYIDPDENHFLRAYLQIDDGGSWVDVTNDSVEIDMQEIPPTINSLNELQAIRWKLEADYTLGDDIPASGTSTMHEINDAGSWGGNKVYRENDLVSYHGNTYYAVHPHVSNSQNNPEGSDNWTETSKSDGDYLGFHPVGEDGDEFEGIFDGQEHYINNLHIDRPDEEYVGLFGRMGSDSRIEDTYLYDVDIVGYRNVGGLAGRVDEGDVHNSYSDGDAEATDNLGGLIGRNNGEIYNSYSKANVNSDTDVGGLVGINSELISKCYSTGSVTGDSDLGGLVGDKTTSGETKDSFWDTETSGISTSVGGTGKTTEEMKTFSTFHDAGWNITARWGNEPTYPYHGSSWTIDQSSYITDISVRNERVAVASTDGVYLIEEDGSETEIDAFENDDWPTTIEYSSEYIIVGTRNGSVHLYEDDGSKIDSMVDYHEGSITDMDSQFVDEWTGWFRYIHTDFVTVCDDGEIRRSVIDGYTSQSLEPRAVNEFYVGDEHFTSVTFWSDYQSGEAYTIVGNVDSNDSRFRSFSSDNLYYMDKKTSPYEDITDLDFACDADGIRPYNNKIYYSSKGSSRYGWFHLNTSDGSFTTPRGSIGVDGGIPTALAVKRDIFYKPLEDDLHFWMYDYNNNFTSEYRHSSSQVHYKNSTINYGFQIWHSLTISQGKWVNKQPTTYFKFREVKEERDTSIVWSAIVSFASAVGEIARTTISAIGDLPPIETLMEWARNGAEWIESKLNNALNTIGGGLQTFGSFIYDVGKRVVEAVVYYGSALLSLGIIAFSIFAYLAVTIIVMKSCFGMVVLVTKGTDAMFEYYEHFMDNILSLSKGAMDMLPVV